MNRILVFFALIAGIASAQSHIRTFELITDNTTFPTPANVSWMQGESPKFSITAKYGNYYVAFSNGAAPVLKMWSGSVVTQLYAIKTGSVYNASSGKLTVELAANEANIQPAGEYNYAVGVYDGTNYMGVVAQGKATVKAHPFGASVGYVGTSSLFNFVPTNEAPVTNAYIVGSSGTGNVAKVGRRLAITFPAGGGGSGTFTNLVWNGNANTAQAIVLGESNVVLRYTGGTSYVGLASSITGDLTFNGAINANDHIEIANTKHLRFQDGGGTNTVHLEAVRGRLIITGAVDIVSGQAVPATINGSVIATGTPLYVHSETNASARLASNVWAAADSTTNYVRKTGGNYAATGAWSFVAGGSNNPVTIQGSDGVSVLGKGGDVNVTAGNGDTFGGSVFISAGAGDSGAGDVVIMRGDTAILSTTGTLVNAVFGFSGNGAGITDLNAGALTNIGSGLALSAGKLTATSVWFSSIATNGTGNVVTNLVGGGSVITQQMGTTSAAATPSRVAVPIVWGGFRSLTTNSSVLPVRGFVGGDSLTATSALSLLSFVVSATNTAQEKFGVAEISWPMSAATGITVTTYFQTSANGMSLVFYNGVSNAVAYPIAGVAGTSTTNLAATGFLTSAAQGDSVQVTCFSTNISTNAASTVVNGISQRITVTK